MTGHDRAPSREPSRFHLALEQYERALQRLHEVLALSETDVVRDALIQRFEFTFEMAWKAMYRWLRERAIAVDDSAYTVLPVALRHRLIGDEAGWAQMRQQRNLTSHTYREALAIEVAAYVRGSGVRLLDDALATLKSRAGE